MAFLRRKSEGYHENVHQETFEPHRRRRLSKPLTNSAANLQCLNTQQDVQKSSIYAAEPNVLSTTSPNGSREASRLHLFPYLSDLELNKPTPKRSTVALMTAKLEHSGLASASHSSLISSKISQRSLSHMLSFKKPSNNHKPSISSLGSKDCYAEFDLGPVSANSSLEKVVEDPAPPARRVASFTPGMATRVGSKHQDLTPDGTETISEQPAVVTVTAGSDDTSGDEVEETWIPPPQNDRPVTPMGLEYAHIGPISLGSLRVVNGSTSPTLSVASKVARQTWKPTICRATSSVYNESEAGTLRTGKVRRNDYQANTDSSTTKDRQSQMQSTGYRAFSFKPGSEARLSQCESETEPSPNTHDAEVYMTADATAIMAEEYMSALPVSPFASSPAASSPRSPDYALEQTLPTPKNYTVHNATTLAIVVMNEPSPVSDRDAQRHSDESKSRHSYFGETLGSSPSPTSNTLNLTGSPVRPDSPISFYSVLESGHVADEAFKSAVELQPSRTRSKSPQKRMEGSPLTEIYQPRHQYPQRPKAPKSDSGYSSNTFASTIIPSNGLEAQDSAESQKRGFRFPFRKSVQSLENPTLAKPTLSKKVAAPVGSEIDIVSAMSSSPSIQENSAAASAESVTRVPTSPAKEKEQTKVRKKLQKHRRKSTVEVAGALVIQRLASVECLNVPPVSTTARSNLAIRSMTVPELQKTYTTQDDTAAQHHAASTFSLASQRSEVRFPSPSPEHEQERGGRSRSQSRNRRRSTSRPRSWFSWSKGEKEDQRHQSQRHEQVNLNDLGSVVDALGGSPYDVAYTTIPGVPVSAWTGTRPDLARRRTSPSNITTKAPRPKSMMDDASASKLSKMRRLSIGDKIARQGAIPFFDDRGGRPGKLPNCAQLAVDAPPMPPMPSADEINTRYSRRCEIEPQIIQAACIEKLNSDTTYVEEPDEAPPPPPHSPLPAYVDDIPVNKQKGWSHAAQGFVQSSYSDSAVFDDEDVEDYAIAPPPPSHSPRPMDITNYYPRLREVSWTAQADGWKARRQSAGAALKTSYAAGIEVDNYTVTRKPLPHGALSYSRHSYEVTHEPQRSREQIDHPYQQWSDKEYHEQEYYNEDKPQGQLPYTYARHYTPSQYHDTREEAYQDVAQPVPQDYRPTTRARTWSNHNNPDYRTQPQHSGDSPRFYAQYEEHGYFHPGTGGQLHSQSYSHDDPYISPDQTQSTSVQRRSRSASQYGDVFASRKSLAEELRPDLYDDRRHKRSSWLDMEAYGVELLNVPVLSVPVGSTGSRMVYH